MRNLASLICLVLALVAATPAAVRTQERPTPADGAITAATRKAVIDSLAVEIDRQYVFPAVGKETIKALRRHADRGDYQRITTARAFADTLNDHLYAVAHDLHLRVHYDPTSRMQIGCGGGAAVDVERIRAMAGQRNFGFEKVQRLAGNVGYLDLRVFDDPASGAGEVVAAAMGFLAHCDALIIDVRRNGGGFAGMVNLLITYLTDPAEQLHLFDFHYRGGPEAGLRSDWTLPYVPGPRFAGKDVYVLTGQFTGSAAESFAYALQAAKRATLVGEQTAGAGNPGSGMTALPGGFSAFIAAGRVVSPVTGTNWEGVGVKPDVAAAADTALRVAHVMAVERLLGKAVNDEEKTRLTRSLDAARKTLPDPVEPPAGLRIIRR
jgi:hypothetical protein